MTDLDFSDLESDGDNGKLGCGGEDVHVWTTYVEHYSEPYA